MQVKLKPVKSKELYVAVGDFCLKDAWFASKYLDGGILNYVMLVNNVPKSAFTVDLHRNVAEIHAFIGSGLYYRHYYTPILREYITVIFNNTPASKVVITTSDRLVDVIARLVGFTLEGTHRKEALNGSDLRYYGMFREEFDPWRKNHPSPQN